MNENSLSLISPIGVAGCGRMGAPMVRALIGAGFDVAGLDVLPAHSFGDLTPLMTDAATFAASRRIVLSVVRDVAQTEELLFDDQALITRRPSAIDTVLICSTLSPRYIAGLRKRISAEISLIDAPMSGASVSAEEARLSFMLGGDEKVVDRLQPLFAAMGDKIHHLGPLGAGMTAKVLNNFCAASSTAATRTVLRWAAAGSAIAVFLAPAAVASALRFSFSETGTTATSSSPVSVAASRVLNTRPCSSPSLSAASVP